MVRSCSKYITIGLLVLLLAACKAPTTEPTTIAADQAQVATTPTTLPSATPTALPSATPEPTATPTATPAPLPITSENVGRLTLANFSDLGRTFLGDPAANWGSARRNPDGSSLVVETSRGIDVLDGSSLDLVAQYADYVPVDMLASGEVAASLGSDVVFLNLENGETGHQWTLDDPSVAWGVSPDGTTLAYATGERTFDLVNLATGEIRNLNIQRSIAPVGIVDFSFRPDSAMLFVTHKTQGGSRWIAPPNAAQLFEVASGQQLYEIGVQGPIVYAPEGGWYAYDGNKTEAAPAYLARIRDDSPAEYIHTSFSGKLYSIEHSSEGYSLINFPAAAMSFQADPKTLGVLYLGSSMDSRTEYHSGPSTQFLIWNLEDGTIQTTFTDFEYPYPITFAFAPDGKTFFTASFDGTLQLRDSATAAVISSIAPYAYKGAASLSPSGTQITVPDWDHFEIWDTDSLEQVDRFDFALNKSLPGFSYFVMKIYDNQVTFLDDNLIGFWSGYVGGAPPYLNFFGAFSTRTAYTYDLASQEVIREFSGGENDLYDCKYNQNGNRQICLINHWGEPTAYQISDPSTGELLLAIKPDSAASYAFSNQGELFAFCREDAKSISITPLNGGVYRPYSFPCQDMIFLPGDTQILLADGSVIDLESKEAVGAFAFAESYANFGSVFFSPNGDFMLIGTDIYSLPTGELLGQLDTTNAINGIALSEDGLTLIVLTEFGLEYWQGLQ